MDLRDEALALLGQTADVLCRVDREGRVLQFIAGERFAARGRQVVGRLIGDMLPPERARLVLGAIAECLERQDTVVIDYLTTGDRFVRARLMPASDGTVLGHAADVTEEVAARNALAASDERCHLLARATTDAIFDWDAVADRVTWNPQLQSTFGYAEETTTLAWWLDRVHPDDRAAIEASAAEATAGRAPDLWCGEYRWRTADGRFADVAERSVIVRDAEGRVVRVVGSMLDVTEQKALRARLAIADRVLALGTLAASLAHEINNPLNYVVGNVALAMQHLASAAADPAVAAARECLRDAEHGSARVAAVVASLGTMSRGGADAFTAVDLRAVVRDALKSIAAPLMAGVDVRVHDAGELPCVAGNAHQLVQVVTNLVENALHALTGIAGPRRLSIALSSTASHVALRVVDTGAGIAVDDLPRIFDPFFTTKAPGGGTGLGLAVAHSIITHHHGHVSVTSDRGGTTFEVTLPVAVEAQPALAPTASRLRVLVVDDDVVTRHLIERILAHEHDVVAVGGSQAAMDEVRRRGFDVVLCDVVMPGQDGRALRDALVATHGACFGFVTAGGVHVDERVGDTPCLRKPFTPDALRGFVRGLAAHDHRAADERAHDVTREPS